MPTKTKQKTLQRNITLSEEDYEWLKANCRDMTGYDPSTWMAAKVTRCIKKLRDEGVDVSI